MSLPSRVLRLIREYSLPITRADWRKSKPIISTYRLYTIIRKRRRNTFRPINVMLLNNIENTDWYFTCKYIQTYGLDNYYDEYFRQYGIKYDEIIHNVHAIEGVTDAIYTFNWLHKII